MPVRVYSEQLPSFGADRAKALYDEGVLEAIYVKVHPLDAAALSNKGEWAAFRAKGIPLWGWIVCSADQGADVAAVQDLDFELQPDGFLLNIEKVLEGAKLVDLCKGLMPLGKPLVASLAGESASPVEYDYREMEQHKITVEWQAYADSKEGPAPGVAVAELFQCGFVIGGYEYRHQAGDRLGYGRVTRVEQEELAVFDSYLRPGKGDSVFGVLPREEWGWTVDDRVLWPRDPELPPIGRVLGRTPYPRIRVAIVSDQIAAQNGITRTLEQWSAWAASARWPGARKRGVSVYLGERASNEMLRAVAKGAG